MCAWRAVRRLSSHSHLLPCESRKSSSMWLSSARSMSNRSRGAPSSTACTTTWLSGECGGTGPLVTVDHTPEPEASPCSSNHHAGWGACSWARPSCQGRQLHEQLTGTQARPWPSPPLRRRRRRPPPRACRTGAAGHSCPTRGAWRGCWRRTCRAGWWGRRSAPRMRPPGAAGGAPCGRTGRCGAWPKLL